MKLSFRIALACMAFAGSALPAFAQAPEKPQPCQRECLEGYMDKYLAAMRDQKVDPQLFAPDVRFTENGIELPLGNEGLWATASGLGGYKFYVPDVETRQVAFLGTMIEQAPTSATGPQRPPEAVGIDVRLRIDGNGKISEVEQIVARPERPLGAGTAPAGPFPATGAAVEALGAPHPVFLETIPEGERQSREDLVRIANYYFEAIQRNDGKGYYPFTDDCLRIENGMTVVGPPGTLGMGGRPAMGCKERSRHRFTASSPAFATVASSPSTANAGSCSPSRSSTTGRSTGPGNWASCSRSKASRSPGSRRSSFAAPTAYARAGAPTNSAARKRFRTFGEGCKTGSPLSYALALTGTRKA